MNRIEIKLAFKITNRGYVVAGDIVEGRIKTGMYVNYPNNQGGLRIKINGVEILSGSSENRLSYPALVLPQKICEDNGIANESAWVGKIVSCTE